MLFGNIINNSFGLLSKQLKFYCWHYRRNLDKNQKQELIDILHEQHFERLSTKIRALIQNNIADCKQQITKLLFEQCLVGHRRHQLIQLINSKLLDLDVRLDNYGRTLLHRMAYNLDVEVVKLLLDNGVNIRLRDYAGNTALHIAIQSYRNGALVYNNNELNLVDNLETIIKLLLEADKQLQIERSNLKRIKLDEGQGQNRDDLEAQSNNESNDSKFNNEQLSANAIIDTAYGKSRDLSVRQIEESQAIHGSRNNSSASGKLNNDYTTSDQEQPAKAKQVVQPTECPPCSIRPLLLEDSTCSLVDTKNAFGRTALHYCVLVVGEQYLGHFVQLLISFGADTDAIDTRLKTPLHCLVKRPAFSAIRQKCLAIKHLLNSGCDDLGLAIEPQSYFLEEFISHLEKNIPSMVQASSTGQVDPIFSGTTFKRVPSLMHLARLALIKLHADEYSKMSLQTAFVLPPEVPQTLSQYLNRKILDQSELF